MKKALIVALLVGLMAAPSFAGLLPNPPTRVNNFTSSPFGDVAERGFPYDGNNPSDVYDNMIYIGGFSNGPSTFYAGGVITLGAGVFMCDDMTLAPGTTFLGSIPGTGSGGIDWVFNNSFVGPGSHNVTLAFFSNPGGNDTSLGATIAAFSFGGSVGNGYYLLSAGLPAFAVPTTDIWTCIAHSVTTRHFFSGNPVHGAPGTANPAQPYQGSSDNLMLVLSTAGATLLTGGTAPALFNTNWTLQAVVPEPSVAGLLVVGGLLALRRRKA